jgi:hypothetical protein
MLIWWISYSRQIVARGGITLKVLQVPPPRHGEEAHARQFPD